MNNKSDFSVYTYKKYKDIFVKILSLFLLFLCCVIEVKADEKTLVKLTKIYMAGDSTMSIKEIKDYPETGWGVPFSFFFNENTVVDNRAKNGRSTKTFITENRWQSIMDELKEGDYVFIQFGHNDQSKHKVDRYTTPKEFTNNLTRFITEVRSHKAVAILMTPITRRNFNANGTMKNTHPIYADLVREVAKSTEVAFIDMEKITQQYFQQLGDKQSSLRFMHIPPNTHPNYPVGVRDNTHLNSLGAREVAQLVLKELKVMNSPLVNHLRTPDPKHLKLRY